MLRITLDIGQTIKHEQLNGELALLALPNFTGTAVLPHEVDDAGRAVLENGKAKKVQPYLLVKVGVLTAAQDQSVREAVAAHVPTKNQAEIDEEAAEADIQAAKQWFKDNWSTLTEREKRLLKAVHLRFGV